jgi:predicted nucleotidyltransferase
MKSKEKLLNEIKRRVQQVAPGAEVYLYGSRARGEGGLYSDWDVLILVKRETIDYAFEKQLTYPLYDLEFETGEVISPMVYSKQAWNTKHKKTPFYHQITPELITL